MKDIFTFGNEKDVAQTGELTSPVRARLDAIDGFLGAATVALNELGVTSQPGLAPFIAGHVEDISRERRNQQLGLEPAVQPMAPIESVVKVDSEMDNAAYVDRLVSDPAPSHVSEISPAARAAVMDSTVYAPNGYQEAA